MTADELQRLARATCAWLAYRYLIDPTTIYERLLLIPICEFLAANSAWKPANELSYGKLFGDRKLNNFYADIVGTKKGGKKKFLLETKLLRYLATRRWEELESEIVRLAVPTGQLPRYLLLAGPAEYFVIPSNFKPSKEAKIFRKALGFNYREGFDIQLPEDVSGKEAKLSYIRRWADVSVSVGKNSDDKDRKDAREEERSYRLVIWSVNAARSAPRPRDLRTAPLEA